MAFLYDLVTMVRQQIRDTNTSSPVFQDWEMTQFVNDAIAQYSRYKPRRRPLTLNLVTGQTTYALPSDWMGADLVSFDRAVNPRPHVAQLGVYAYEFDWLMTMPANIALRNIYFDWYDSDQTVVLNPAPLQNYTLTFDYNAIHQATNDAECTIPQQEQYIAMYWACAQALYALITDKADKLMRYTAKDVSVDNTEIVEGLEKRADGFMQRWEKEIMQRPLGMKGGDLGRMNSYFPYGGLTYGPW